MKEMSKEELAKAIEAFKEMSEITKSIVKKLDQVAK